MRWLRAPPLDRPLSSAFAGCMPSAPCRFQVVYVVYAAFSEGLPGPPSLPPPVRPAGLLLTTHPIRPHRPGHFNQTPSLHVTRASLPFVRYLHLHIHLSLSSTLFSLRRPWLIPLALFAGRRPRQPTTNHPLAPPKTLLLGPKTAIASRSTFSAFQSPPKLKPDATLSTFPFTLDPASTFFLLLPSTTSPRSRQLLRTRGRRPPTATLSFTTTTARLASSIVQSLARH